MVADQESVCIRNVTLKSPPIRKFNIGGFICSAVYSQIFDLLIIMSPFSRGENSFTVLDVAAGTSSIFRIKDGRISSIALSQIAKKLVCCMGTPGLEVVDLGTKYQDVFNFPAIATSVSTLSNGITVVNIPGAGIQLLNLDQHTGLPFPPPYTPFPLDKGRITTFRTANVCFELLETATMSRVLSIPIQRNLPIAADGITILCASVENKIAVCSFTKVFEGYLEIREFSLQHPRWTAPTDELASIGSFSPAGNRLVTFHSGRSQSFIRVWDANNGRVMTWIPIKIPPLDITFDSEDRFTLHHNTRRAAYIIGTTSRTGKPTTHSITRCTEQQLALEEQVLGKRYYLDDGHEWVFCGSRRICWVPPGYIRSVPGSHWWAEASLVMIGQDGMLKRLDFLESSL